MVREYTQYLAALLLFGTNGVIASQIHLASSPIVLLRTLIGSLLLAVIFLLGGGRFHIASNRRAYVWLTVSGAAMGASWLLLYEAYRYVGVGIASLCMYSSLILVMIASVVIFREHPTTHKLLCFLVAVSGTALVNIAALSEQMSIYGLALGMAACLSYAVMIIISKLSSGVADLEKATWQLIIACFITAIITTLQGNIPFDVNTGDILWIAVLGILNTGIGCYFYFSSINRLPAQTVAICDNIELLSAVLSAAVFLGEHLAPPQWIGTILIILGAAASTLKRNVKTERCSVRQQTGQPDGKRIA